MLSTQLINRAVNKSGLNAWAATQPRLPKRWKKRFNDWIEKKYYADMDWIVRNPDIRVNIKKKYSWCQSVLVFADNYYTPPLRKKNIPYVSNYAYGKNYHQIVIEKIQSVAQQISDSHPDIKYKAYVDTGPILERAYAVESGLGWMGKNNMIIINGLGSYCFLGILLLNAKIEEYGSPLADKCGDCRKCIENCPTGALEDDYIHNSQKCLSYLTIEKKGAFSNFEEELISDTLYGCDVCQEVCPWNRKWAHKTEDHRYFDRKNYLQKPKTKWKKVNKKEFKQIFQDSVFKRLKYSRLQRNLAALDKL